MLYRITTFVGHPLNEGSARRKIATIRRKENAALHQLEQAVYVAAEAQGLRDTEAAHKAIRLARSWTRRHPIQTIVLGDHYIYITTSREA